MKNVLILDDNRDILNELSTSLCGWLKDCNILTALNGEKGEDILRSVPIDLILTDLGLLVANGYKFIEYARKNHPSVPVCVMTGNCPPSVLERLNTLGVSNSIEKPFTFEKLARLISEALKLKQHDSRQEGTGYA